MRAQKKQATTPIDHLSRRLRDALKGIPIEPHPSEYEGFPQVCVIQYSTNTASKDHLQEIQQQLVIIDQFNEESKPLAFDLCAIDEVDDRITYEVLSNWNQEEMPLSFYVSINGYAQHFVDTWFSLSAKSVKCVIGNIPAYNWKHTSKRSRKIKRTQ